MENRNKQPDLPRRRLARRFLPKVSLGFDHTWIIAALLFLGVIASLSPLVPHDFWWHLKAGEMIAVNHIIPSTNIFAWPLPADTPFVYASWLGELFLYWLYKLGGLEIVIFFRNIVTVVAFAVMAFEAKHQSGSWKLAALSLFGSDTYPSTLIADGARHLASLEVQVRLALSPRSARVLA